MRFCLGGLSISSQKPRPIDEPHRILCIYKLPARLPNIPSQSYISSHTLRLSQCRVTRAQPFARFIWSNNPTTRSQNLSLCGFLSHTNFLTEICIVRPTNVSAPRGSMIVTQKREKNVTVLFCCWISRRIIFFIKFKFFTLTYDFSNIFYHTNLVPTITDTKKH